ACSSIANNGSLMPLHFVIHPAQIRFRSLAAQQQKQRSSKHGVTRTNKLSLTVDVLVAPAQSHCDKPHCAHIHSYVRRLLQHRDHHFLTSAALGPHPLTGCVYPRSRVAPTRSAHH